MGIAILKFNADFYQQSFFVPLLLCQSRNLIAEPKRIDGNTGSDSWALTAGIRNKFRFLSDIQLPTWPVTDFAQTYPDRNRIAQRCGNSKSVSGCFNCLVTGLLGDRSNKSIFTVDDLGQYANFLVPMITFHLYPSPFIIHL